MLVVGVTMQQIMAKRYRICDGRGRGKSGRMKKKREKKV